jgi:hypothetical protein
MGVVMFWRGRSVSVWLSFPLGFGLLSPGVFFPKFSFWKQKHTKENGRAPFEF